MRSLSVAWVLVVASVIGGSKLSAQWPNRPEVPDVETLRDTSNIAVAYHRGSHRFWHPGLPRCRDSTPLIVGDSVGPLRTGVTIASLRVECPGSWYVWFYNWDFSPAMGIMLGDMLVFAVFRDTFPASKVEYAFVGDSVGRTSKGVGVGSTYSEFETAHGHGSARAGGECSVEAVFKALPGLSVALDQSRVESECGEGGPRILSDARIIGIYLDPKPDPTPAEVARGSDAGPQWVSDDAFLAATLVTWPRPVPAVEATKVPWGASDMPQCGQGIPLITGDSLGPLSIGATPDKILTRCPRPLHVWVLERNGEPALALKVGDARIVARVTDTTSNGKVRLIDITDQVPRTADGFGVGTRVSDILAAHRDPAMIAGEGSCTLSFHSLRGLTFILRPEDCRAHAPGEPFRLDQLVSPDARVTEIRIKGLH